MIPTSWFWLIPFVLLPYICPVTSVTNSSSRCIESEKNALLDLKSGFLDPSNRLHSWRGDSCCNWNGVHCTGNTGHVTELDLSCPTVDSSQGVCVAGLQGEIHYSLANLKHLEYLDLSYNSFQGILIPESIGSLGRLKYLNLSSAGFSGRIPPHLGNLSKLQTLDIRASGFNLFSEDVTWVSHLHSLQHLDMSSVNLSLVPANTNWLQATISMPSLSTLRMSGCQIVLPLQWSSMHLNRSSSIMTLDLSANEINSTVPSWLFNLSRLVHLDLGTNYLQGSIPVHFSSLPNLAILRLTDNYFSGALPSSALTNISSLQELDLSYNRIEGDIQELLGRDSVRYKQMDSMQNLYLTSNRIRGNFSKSCWGIYKNLKLLRFDMNNLTGGIPNSTQSLTQLIHLDLSQNHLNGVISRSHLEHLVNLKRLVLASNRLRFDVGTDWSPRFRIEHLDLSGCNLGPNFPIWLQTQTRLRTLYLNNVGISTAIPPSFWSGIKTFGNLYVLSLSGNQIMGSLPRFMLFTNISTLDLSSNLLKGPLPAIASSTIQNLIFSNNSLSGSVPTSLCEMNSLQYLVLAGNKLSGRIPSCWRQTSRLEVVHLGNNNFSGVIPEAISNLKQLRSLHLNNNNLHGRIPTSMKNCVNLVGLNLGENKFHDAIPAWMGKDLPTLGFLRLRSNMFYGDVPENLAQLSLLGVLDLAYNNLSGSIPDSFGNLTSMRSTDNMEFYNNAAFMPKTETMVLNTKGQEYNFDLALSQVTMLDLSSNHLSGTIPKDLFSLNGLRILNLSNNDFTGDIPDGINGLHKIESLDLSRNQLSGPIPTEASMLSFLAHFNVSYNHLSGKIPIGGQLQTFVPSSYEGNENLCGEPLAKRCQDNATYQNPKSPDGNNSREITGGYGSLGFYASAIFGFIMGFWLFYGSLFLSRYWRSFYYNFLERILQSLGI